MDGTSISWDNVINKITPKVPSAAINTWFKRTKLQKFNNGVVVVGCADSFVRDWMDSNYRNLLLETIQELINKDVTITFIIDRSFTTKKENSKKSNKKEETKSTLFDKEKLITTEGYRFESNLNNRYNFETFVVGPSNRLAHAAAEAVSSRLGGIYNPLFIYGGVGLGKTHLMQAIGNRTLLDDSSKCCYYCSSERFLNEMVEAIRGGKTTQFREKYRSLDLLIIDDIQFISNWQETQNELFHTFNEIYLANKQIVFASDRPPSEIANLMDRLRSRFEGGMVADIQPPTFEMRIAILKKKAEQLMIYLPEEILITIAQYVESNIRELEGALNRIYTHKNVTGIVPTAKDVRDLLKKDIEIKRKKVSPKSVISEVAKEFNLKIADLKGKSRKKQVSIPRQIAMYVIREDLGYKLEDTAGYLKRKDHTTVIHAVDKISEMMQNDSGLREKIERIRGKIKSEMLG